MRDIFDVPGDQIVNRDNPVTFCEQAIGQVRAEKSRSAGHD